jgi:uncharacterized protein YdaU (DUF1376 family)
MEKSPLPFFPVYVGDFMKITSGLTQTECGAYIGLLVHYFGKSAPVPHDRRYTITKAITKAEKVACDAVLRSHFQQDPQTHLWHSREVEEQIADMERRAERSRQNGAKGGRPAKQENPVGSFQDTQQKPSANLDGTNPQSDAQPEPQAQANTPIPNKEFKTPKEGLRGENIRYMLSDDALARAKSEAQGYDIYRLMEEYAQWLQKNEMPNDINKAFPIWCRRFYEKRHHQ